MPDDPALERLRRLSEEFGAGGLPVTLVESDGPVTAQLLVEATDGEPWEVPVSAYFVPGLDDPLVVQCFALLPYDVRAGSAARLSRFVCSLNATLPAGGFEFDDETSLLAFRHTAAVADPVDPSLVAWSLSMTVSAVATFGGLLQEVAGGLPLATARTRLRELVDQL